MNNPFREYFTSLKPADGRFAVKALYRFADDAGMRQATLYNVVNPEQLPPGTQYGTMQAAAKALGCRLIIQLEPIGENGE